MTVRDTLTKVQLAALTAAARHKLLLPMEALDDIAAAVLAAYDEEVEERQSVVRDLWNDPGIRAYVEQDMRRRLALHLVENDLLPTARPRLTVWSNDGQPWSYTIDLVLTVPARKLR